MGIDMLWSSQQHSAIIKEATYAYPTRARGLNDSQIGKKSDSNGPDSLKSAFIRGFWTNALNAKVALFFLAFLPQFSAPDAANQTLSFALLGLIFNLNALPINIGYGLGAAWVSQRRRNRFSRFSQFNPTSARQSAIAWLERGAGALLVYFGVKLALSDNRT